MSDQTRIEWADATWNPMTGCTPVSEACEHCYALRMLSRNLPHHSGPDPTFHPDRLDKPLHWRKPRRIFVCSMSDLFHEAFTDEQIDDVCDVMYRCPQHTFMVLTKRPERMQAAAGYWAHIPNLYLGVTAETQQRADERIPILLDTPAAVRFVSLEPMLGPVRLSADYHDYLAGWDVHPEHDPYCNGSCVNCPVAVQFETPKLDWVILGGETGPGARSMQPEWALDVWRQCRAAGVPFFFKQVGTAWPDDCLATCYGTGLEMACTREFPGGEG